MSRLEFVTASKADSGKYSCKATNSVGSKEFETEMIVFCKYSFFFYKSKVISKTAFTVTVPPTDSQPKLLGTVHANFVGDNLSRSSHGEGILIALLIATLSKNF